MASIQLIMLYFLGLGLYMMVRPCRNSSFKASIFLSVYLL